MSTQDQIATSAELGALIRRERQAAAMTQQDLADRAETTRQWIMRLERGHSNASMGKALAALSALGLEMVAQHDLASVGLLA